MAMAQNLKGLQSLDIWDNHNLTDASLVHIYTHYAETLHTLRLNTGYEGENMYEVGAVNELLSRCTHLQILSLDYWSGDDRDDGITLPATTLGNLTTLILKGNSVCDCNIIAIGRYAVKLRILALLESNCQVDSSFMELYNGCPALKEFYFNIPTWKSTDNAYVCGLADFVKELWMKKRPGILMSENFPYAIDKIDVLDI